MAGLIPPEFRDRLLARLDIVDVVQARVPLKRAGRDFRACCPFHDEKTPSFYVSPSKQFYHCFGCGAGGNAIDFLIEYDRLSFREAVEELAAQAGLELPTAAGGPTTTGPDPTPLYAVLEAAAALYRRQLREHPEAARAVAYLKGRGLTADIAGHYGLGYAPSGWDTLLRALGRDAAQVALLAAAGLIVEGDGGRRYDRFRERITFPIHDRRGRVIGFGGRAIGDAQPKYLNSPETAVFHKGRELYGLYQALQARRRPERLIVVEGYLDVIALAQFGIDNAVATLGTATTPEHLLRLARSAPELVFCFDGDRAGRDAAWKALTTALPHATGQQPIRFLFLPDGEDPDTLIRKEGPAAFAQRVAGARLLSAYLIDDLERRFDLATPEGRSAFSDEAARLLDSVAAGSYREQLAAAIAERVPRVGLPGAAGPGTAPWRGPAGKRRPTAVPTPPRLSPLRLAIALVQDNPALATAASARPGDWRDQDNPGVALLAALLDDIAAQPGVTSGQLREHWRDSDEAPILARLSNPRLIDHIPTTGREQELVGAIDALNREVARAQRQRRLLGALGGAAPARDPPARDPPP